MIHLSKCWLAVSLILSGLDLSAASNIPASSFDLHKQQDTASIFTQSHGPLYATASASDIQKAEQLVASAVIQQGVYNAYRVANARRNNYRHEAPPSGSRKRDASSNGPQPPDLNNGLLAAAALLAERDVALQLAKDTLQSNESTSHATNNEKRAASASSSTWWLPAMSKNGLPPMGYNPSYPVRMLHGPIAIC